MMNPTIIAIILVAVIIASAFFKRLPTQFILCNCTGDLRTGSGI